MQDDARSDMCAQFPFLNGYTHLLYGFQVSLDVPETAVVNALTESVERLIAQIPWLGGQVKHVPGPTGSTGEYVPAPWPDDWPSPNGIVRVKDCIDCMPSMSALLEAHAPIGLLDGNLLAPWPSLPSPHGIEGPMPIAAIQANLIQGGVLLTFTLHHIVFDATSILQFVRLLSIIMGGGQIPDADLEQALRDRRNVIRSIGVNEPMKDFTHLRMPPGFVRKKPASSPQWCYYELSFRALARLKQLPSASASTASASTAAASLAAAAAAAAAPRTPTSREAQQTSESDLISAFCWQRISAVRLARGASAGFTPATLSRLHRAIDGRAALGIPFSYIGHIIFHAIVRCPLGEITSTPLPALALMLRRHLNATNNAWTVRSYATFVAREPNKHLLLYGGQSDPNTDLGVTTTIASMGTAQGDSSPLPSMGPLLGIARFLRRPQVAPLTSSVTINPVEENRIPIALCLPEQDITGLQSDSQWTRHMVRVG